MRHISILFYHHVHGPPPPTVKGPCQDLGVASPQGPQRHCPGVRDGAELLLPAVVPGDTPLMGGECFIHGGGAPLPPTSLRPGSHHNYYETALATVYSLDKYIFGTLSGLLVHHDLKLHLIH